MALILWACLYMAISTITEARVCVVGNEPDPEIGMRWVTVPEDDPCDCSMILPGGLNVAPSLYSGVPVPYPMVSDDPETIRRHFQCDDVEQEVNYYTESTDDPMTSPNSPHSKWLQLFHYDRFDPTAIHLNQNALDQWKVSEITEVKISLDSNASTGKQLELIFDATGCNSTSWFTYERLLNSPWDDLDNKAVFSLNLTANGAQLFGIHAELRGQLSVGGWLRLVTPGVDEALIWETETPPVIAFAKNGRVHWMDRDVLSRGQPASQYPNLPPALGMYAVDLNFMTRTSTVYEFEPWWMVDMGNIYEVEEVLVTGCAPGEGKTELTGAQFRVGTTRDIDAGTPCGLPVTDPAEEGTRITVYCLGYPAGQYLSMRIDRGHGTLGFCGIQVDAEGGADPQLGQTWQSSVLTHNASQSVDGLVGIHVTDPTCSQTGNDNKPWWRVDLGEIVTVNMVVVSPFPDLTQWTDMSGASIFVSDVDDPALSSVGVCGSALLVEELLEHRPLSIECQPSVNGRYVFIKGNKSPISMCEFEVFGKEIGEVYHADTLSIHALVPNID